MKRARKARYDFIRNLFQDGHLYHYYIDNGFSSNKKAKQKEESDTIKNSADKGAVESEPEDKVYSLHFFCENVNISNRKRMGEVKWKNNF